MRIPPPVPDYPGKEKANELLRPLVEPVAKKLAQGALQRLIGFWTMWHLLGGREGLAPTFMHRRSVWKNREEFVRAFGVEVEDFAPAAAEALRNSWAEFAPSFTQDLDSEES